MINLLRCFYYIWEALHNLPDPDNNEKKDWIEAIEILYSPFLRQLASDLNWYFPKAASWRLNNENPVYEIQKLVQKVTEHLDTIASGVDVIELEDDHMYTLTLKYGENATTLLSIVTKGFQSPVFLMNREFQHGGTRGNLYMTVIEEIDRLDNCVFLRTCNSPKFVFAAVIRFEKEVSRVLNWFDVGGQFEQLPAVHSDHLDGDRGQNNRDGTTMSFSMLQQLLLNLARRLANVDFEDSLKDGARAQAQIGRYFQLLRAGAVYPDEVKTDVTDPDQNIATLENKLEHYGFVVAEHQAVWPTSSEMRLKHHAVYNWISAQIRFVQWHEAN